MSSTTEPQAKLVCSYQVEVLRCCHDILHVRMLFEGGAEVRPEQTQNYESKQGDVYHVFNDPDCPELHGLVVDISNHEATGLGCLAAAVDFTFGLNTKDMENGGSYFVDSARVQASMRFFGTIINDDAQQAAMDGAEVS